MSNNVQALLGIFEGEVISVDSEVDQCVILSLRDNSPTAQTEVLPLCIAKRLGLDELGAPARMNRVIQAGKMIISLEKI